MSVVRISGCSLASRMNSESGMVPGTSSPPRPITRSDTTASQVAPLDRLDCPK